MNKVVCLSMYLAILLVYDMPTMQGCQTDTFTLESVAFIQERYYTIRRLEDPIKVFEKAQKELVSQGKLSHHGIAPLLEDSLCSLFKHPTVQTVAKELVTKKNLTPFYRLWGDLLSYKCMNDALFLRESVALLLVLYRHLLLVALGSIRDENSWRLIQHIDNSLLNSQKNVYPIDALIGTIGIAADRTNTATMSYSPELTSLLATEHQAPSGLCQAVDCGTVPEGLNSLMKLLDEACNNNALDTVVVDNNARFYYIQRLLRPMFILAQYDNNFEFSKHLACASFNHTRIKACSMEIQKTKSLIPLFKTWRCFVSYEFINDKLFLKEFIQLIVLIYHDREFSTQQLTHKNSELSIVDFLDFYQTIAALPIYEMLDLLDDTVDSFAQSVEEYELNNKDLTWSEWLKHYWWAPPIMVGSFITILFRHAKTLKKIINAFFKKCGPIGQKTGNCNKIFFSAMLRKQVKSLP